MEKKLINIALSIFNLNEGISLDSRRDEIEKWDSLAHLQLIMEIEDQLGIFVPIEFIGNIKCLRDFLHYIK